MVSATVLRSDTYDVRYLWWQVGVTVMERNLSSPGRGVYNAAPSSSRNKLQNIYQMLDALRGYYTTRPNIGTGLVYRRYTK